MKVRTIGLGIVLGVALAASPVFAQDPKGGGGAPGGGASERTGGGGAAANSGGGVSGGNVGAAGGGGSVATGGSSAGSSSGMSFNSPSGNGATASNLSFGDRGFREARPSHRPGYAAANATNAGVSDSDQKATPRTASGTNNASGGSGERAVPRGSSASGSGSNSANGSGNTRARTPPPSSSGGENNSAGAREVPNWSRPRGDRPATGTAVDRVGPPPDRDHGYGGGGRYYDPYYGYGGYYGSYYSPYYSCGYGYYYGCNPWTFGLGYGLYSGFGWNPYVGDPSMMYGGGGYYEGSGGYSSGVYNTRDQGNLKLKVKPRTAKVYVDGYFAGTVDQFDGAFQKLTLNGGRHKVEVRADGFETAEFDVLITPDQTVTFQGELKRIQ
jgi:hypothetical protein